MNRIFTICAALLMTASVFAQAPEKMSYQAVVRDGSNNLVSSTAVGMRIQILQGSEFGAAVYVETQTPTSNANGLVSLEIGTGTVVSGTFATIDWANGPYFIKTETDLTGGTSYTITGTSQLLSVPYALHAKTAETVTGTITETDPIFGASVASGITGADTTNWNNKQDQLTAGTGIDITGNTISATTYSIGEFAHGGIVFWVDETGQHGLVCAKEDQSTGVRWYAGTYGNTQAKGDGPYAGEANTSIIIAAQVAIGDDGNTYAARICNELQITEGGFTYGDWYLPSKEELNLMYQNKTTIDATATANGGSGFASAYYWSSTDNSNYFTWRQTFGNGVQTSNDKSSTSRVRAVRAF
ncbi:MAG: DUF1566 domain-containing protein [Brumimicrobium sp.]